MAEGDSIEDELLVEREKGEDVGEYMITVKLVRMEQGAIFNLRSAKAAATNYDIPT